MKSIEMLLIEGLYAEVDKLSEKVHSLESLMDTFKGDLYAVDAEVGDIGDRMDFIESVGGMRGEEL
jgi:hypothetical protein